MKSLISIFWLAFTLAGTFSPARAENSELWKCELRDGKTLQELTFVVEKWTKFVNARIETGAFGRYTLASVAGDLNEVVHLDVYTNPGVWATSLEAMESDEGKVILAELAEVESCTSNSFHGLIRHQD